MASSTRLRSFSAFSIHCFFSRSKCSTDSWLLGFMSTMRAALTTCGTKSAAYKYTLAHIHYSPTTKLKQGVTPTGCNHTGSPCSVGSPTAQPGGGRPPTRQVAGPSSRRQRYRWRQTDDSEQNNTGPLGGPVIIMHSLTTFNITWLYINKYIQHWRQTNETFNHIIHRNKVTMQDYNDADKYNAITFMYNKSYYFVPTHFNTHSVYCVKYQLGEPS